MRPQLNSGTLGGRMTLQEEFSEFVEHLRETSVARELRGCTAAEVRFVEEKFGCTLPLAYKLYLETMGHSAGRLFTHDHLAVTFEYVMKLRDVLDEAMAEPPQAGTPQFRLPQHALVIAGRLGDQFLYILCDQPDDSAVFYV